VLKYYNLLVAGTIDGYYAGKDNINMMMLHLSEKARSGALSLK